MGVGGSGIRAKGWFFWGFMGVRLMVQSIGVDGIGRASPPFIAGGSPKNRHQQNLFPMF